MAASGLGGNDAPAEFRTRAAAVATGASLLARRVGADAPEAFCAGLLHDLGTALLHQHAPDQHAAVVAKALQGHSLLELELDTYGGTHASLAADVLLAWRFPAELCDAIGKHHEPPQRSAPPVRRALQAALALVPELTAGSDSAAALAAAHVRPDDIEVLQHQMADGAEQLAIALRA